MRINNTEFKIKNWSVVSKELVYREALNRGVSLNQMIQIIIREHLHRKHPNKVIE
jgi:hypothetical protein